MATEVTSSLYPSATVSSTFAFTPAVEPRKSTLPTAVSATTKTHESSSMTPYEVEHAVQQMNQLSKNLNHRLSFSIDYKTNDLIVKVVDADTDEVIKELPPAELQKLHRSIQEAVGVLINKLI